MPSHTDDDLHGFMRLALRLSLESVQSGGGPFGAVVVRDGVVVGRGQNRVAAMNDPTAHAEIVAIREACAELGTFTLAGCEIFTSCEPCPMCLGAILWARLDRVWYANTRADAAAIGFDDSLFCNEMSRAINERTLPMRPLLSDEAKVAFQAWQAVDDKTPY